MRSATYDLQAHRIGHVFARAITLGRQLDNVSAGAVSLLGLRHESRLLFTEPLAFPVLYRPASRFFRCYISRCRRVPSPAAVPTQTSKQASSIAYGANRQVVPTPINRPRWVPASRADLHGECATSQMRSSPISGRLSCSRHRCRARPGTNSSL